VSDYPQEVIKEIRGRCERLAHGDARDLTDRDLYDLAALVKLIGEVLDGHVLALAFGHHLARHGVPDTARELDSLRGLLSKSVRRQDSRLSLVIRFYRSGMKKSQFLRDVIKVRPEDEGEQRRYLDRALKEFAGVDRELVARLDKTHIKKS